MSLTDEPNKACEAADTIACDQLAQVEQRIVRLQSLKTLEKITELCRGGQIADCRAIKFLGDHTLCISDHHDVKVFSSALGQKQTSAVSESKSALPPKADIAAVDESTGEPRVTTCPISASTAPSYRPGVWNFSTKRKIGPW